MLGLGDILDEIDAPRCQTRGRLVLECPHSCHYPISLQVVLVERQREADVALFRILDCEKVDKGTILNVVYDPVVNVGLNGVSFELLDDE